MKGSYNPSFGINLYYDTPVPSVSGYFTRAKVLYGLRNSALATTADGYGYIGIVSNSNFQLDTIYRVDMVHSFSGTTHTLNLYINGALDRTYSSTNALYPIKSENTNSVNIINPNILGGNGVYSNAKVFQCLAYNRALTQEEIKYNYEIQKQRFGI